MVRCRCCVFAGEPMEKYQQRVSPRACLFPPSKSALSRLHSARDCCVRVLVLCACVTQSEQRPSIAAPLQRCRPLYVPLRATQRSAHTHAPALVTQPVERTYPPPPSLTQRDDGGAVTGRLRGLQIRSNGNRLRSFPAALYARCDNCGAARRPDAVCFSSMDPWTNIQH